MVISNIILQLILVFFTHYSLKNFPRMGRSKLRIRLLSWWDSIVDIWWPHFVLQSFCCCSHSQKKIGMTGRRKRWSTNPNYQKSFSWKIVALVLVRVSLQIWSWILLLINHLDDPRTVLRCSYIDMFYLCCSWTLSVQLTIYNIESEIRLKLYIYCLLAKNSTKHVRAELSVTLK